MTEPITSRELIDRTGGAPEPFEFTADERQAWHDVVTQPGAITRPVPDLVYDAPTHRDMAMEILAKMPVHERYRVIADAQARALQLEKNEQFDRKPMSIKEAIELEQAMAKGLQTGHCRIVGIEYSPWLGFIRAVRVWDLRDSMWHGVEWRGRLRKNMPLSHPWQYDVRADMLAQGWKVIIGTAPDVASWGIGLQVTSADHALHELGRFGWGVRRLPAFLRAMERGNPGDKGKERRHWDRWAMLAAFFSAAVLWGWLS